MTPFQRRALAYFLFAPFVLAGALGCLVFLRLSDIEGVKQMVEQKISEAARMEVAIGNAELDFTEGIGIRLENVALKKAPLANPEITAKEIFILVQWLPLLSKEVVIEKFELRRPVVRLVRNVRGKVSFANLAEPGSGREPAEGTDFADFKIDVFPQLSVQGGEVDFWDYLVNPQPAPLLLREINFSVRQQSGAAPLGFSLQAALPHANGKAKLVVSGNLRNLSGALDFSQVRADGKLTVSDVPLSLFAPYLAAPAVWSPEGEIVASLESSYSTDLRDDAQLAGNFRYVLAREGKEPAAPGGVLSYRIALRKGMLEVEEAGFQAGDFALKGEGRFGPLRAENPDIAFTLRSGDFLAGKLAAYPPFKLLPQALRDGLGKMFNQGAIAIQTLHFEGTHAQLTHVDAAENLSRLTAEIALKQVECALPVLTLRDLTGVLALKEGKSSIRIEKAYGAAAPTLALTGELNDLFGEPHGAMELAGALSLPELRKILDTYARDPHFRTAIDLHKEVAGEGTARISLSDSFADMRRLTVQGSYAVEKGAVQIAPYKIRNIKGLVHFRHFTGSEMRADAKRRQPWEVRLEHFAGDVETHSFTITSGEADFGDGLPAVKIAAQLRVDAAGLASALALAKSAAYHEHLKNIEFQSGAFLIHLTSAGASFVPAEWRSNIEVEAADVSAKVSADLPVITGLNGRFTVSGEGVALKSMRGRFGAMPVTIEGSLRVRDADPIFALRLAAADLSWNELRKISFFSGLPLNGATQFSGSFTGTPQAFQANGAFDLTPSAYTVADVLIKDPGLPNHLRFEGSVAKLSVFKIKKLVYELDKTRVAGEGTVRFGAKPDFQIRLAAAGAQARALAAYFPPLVKGQAGILDFEITGNGAFHDLEHAVLKGNGRLRDVEIKVSGLSGPLAMNAAVELIDKKIRVQNGEMLAANTRFAYSGFCNWGARPAFDLKISGKKLDMNALFPNQGRFDETLKELEAADWFAKGSGRVVFDLDALAFSFWRLKRVSGELALKNKVFRIARLDLASADKHRLQMQGAMAFSGGKGVKFSADMQAEKINAADFANLFGSYFVNGLSGQFKLLKASLTGEGKTWADVRQSMNGDLAFHLAAGRIDTDKLSNGVSDLFGFETEPPPPAAARENKSEEAKVVGPTPYERISGKFALKNGVARTEDFLYQTEERRLSLVGAFDLNSYVMKTVVGVSPLAALDKIVSKIPVVGKILTAGDEKSLLKTYYQVDGPFSDPKVTTIPFTSIEKRVVGILQGILQSPIDIIPGAKTGE